MRGLLIALGYGYPVAATLAALMTEAVREPVQVGAYSRYADDLTFSGNDVATARGLIKGAQRIVHAEGFVLNPAKTRVMTQRGAQVVTGVTVNRDLGLSRRERRTLRAALHHARTDSKDSQVWRRLQGKVAYLSMLNSQQAAGLRVEQ